MNCPGPNQLFQFATGLVPEEEAGQIEAHLLSCDSCIQSMATLTAADPLESVLSRTGPRESGEDCERLIASIQARLCSNHPDPLSTFPSPELLREMLEEPDREGDLGRLGDYRIVRVVGAGGMGVVLEAEDPVLQRTVAIKVMQPKLARQADARERFRREAILTAAFEHEHVVTIYQVAETRELPWFVMEWLQGESLGARLRRQGHFTPAESLEIARQVAVGLAAAHARGLLHRDIKPDNIWLRQGDDHVKILDFGLVRQHDDRVSLTGSGVILGTPTYMAPEMATGQPVDQRADLFSLGCVLYHMLTGRPPITGRNVVATLVAVAQGQIAAPHEIDRGVPESVSQLTMRLLATRPESRPANAQEVVKHVELTQASLATPRRTGRGKSWWGGAIGGAAAAWAAAAILWLTTARGTLVIEADDSARLRVQGETLVIEDVQAKRSYTVEVGANAIRPGEYRIHVHDEDGGLEFSTSEFKIARHGVQVVRVTLNQPGEQMATSTLNPETTPNTANTPDATPSFLAVDALPIFIEPGEPLSSVAMVQKPVVAEGLTSYTLEPARHRGAITDATYSADGKILVTAGQDGTVRIWDAESPRLLHIIACPGRVKKLALSHNGQRLATVQEGNQTTIVLWDLIGQFGQADWRARMAMKVAREATAISWSIDDRLLAFSDGGIQLLDATQGTVLPNFGMEGLIGRQAWSADGRFLAAEKGQPGSGDTGGIVIWDTVEHKIHSTIQCRSASVPHWSSQGRYVAYATAGDADTVPTENDRPENVRLAINIWDVDRQQVVREIPMGWGESRRVPVRWNADGSLIGAWAKEATTWNVKTGEVIDRRQIPESYLWPVGPVEWQPGTNQLLWLAGGMLRQTNDTEPSLVFNDNHATSFQGAGSAIVRRRWTDSINSSGSRDDRDSVVDVWDVTSRTHRLSFPDIQRATSFYHQSLSPQGRYLAQFDAPSADALELARQSVQGRPDGSGPAIIRLFDLAEGKPLAAVPISTYASALQGSDWSPNQRYLAFESADGQFTVIDMLHPEEQLKISSPRLLNRNSFGSHLIAWSPDSRTVAWPGDPEGIVVSRVVDEQGRIAAGNVKSSEMERSALLPFPESPRRPRGRGNEDILYAPLGVIWTEHDTIGVWWRDRSGPAANRERILFWDPTGKSLGDCAIQQSFSQLARVALPPPGAERQLLAVADSRSVSVFDIKNRKEVNRFELPPVQNSAFASALSIAWFPQVSRLAVFRYGEKRPLSILAPDSGWESLQQIAASPFSTMAMLGSGELLTGEADTLQFWDSDGNLTRNWIVGAGREDEVIECRTDGSTDPPNRLYRVELRNGVQFTVPPGDSAP